MHSEQIQALLQRQLADCDITVSGDGSHFEITVVGDVFDGLRPVKKQQLVYGVLNEHIASGAIHAVNMKLFTRDEWSASQR
jgi:acid stress-induced BolA-like protein IbaG/YrbA